MVRSVDSEIILSNHVAEVLNAGPKKDLSTLRKARILEKLSQSTKINGGSV